MNGYKQLAALNLNSLHAFLLVANHKSFRKAAELTHRSHSAVSAQIRTLEEQVGSSLFQRTTRSVVLTASGEVLLDAVEMAFSELDEGLRQVRESDGAQLKNVRLACSPLLAETRMPGILASFERTHPNVRVTLHELSENWGDMVRSRQVDFAVAPALSSEVELSFEKLFVDPLVVLAPGAQCTAMQQDISLAELSTKPLLLPSGLTRLLLETAARDRGIELRPKHEGSHAHTLVAMAEAGLGYAVLPKSSLQTSELHKTRILAISEPPLSRDIGVLVLRNRRLSPAANKLLLLIREQLAGL